MPARFNLDHRGCQLAYRTSGTGPPVIFIQGVGVHGDGWCPQVRALRTRYRCLTFDNRGIGASQPQGEPPLTVEQMADDALALMDAQGWPSAHIVGHSLGGLVAQQIALIARPRVRSLVLLCTFLRGRDGTRLSPRLLWTGLRSQLGTPRSRRRAFLRLVMPPDALLPVDEEAIAERLAPLFGHDLAEQPPVVRKQLAAMRRYDASARLPELSGLPTLVVSAQHDPIATPHSGRALALRIGGAHYVELADASHGVPLYSPDRINTLLLQHLASAEPRVLYDFSPNSHREQRRPSGEVA